MKKNPVTNKSLTKRTPGSGSRLPLRSIFLAGVFLVTCLLIHPSAKAAEEPYTNFIEGAAVAAGSQFYVTDEKFLSLSSWNKINSSFSLVPQNIVELKFDYLKNIFFYNKKFTVNVNINVQCFNNPYDTSQFFQEYNNITLTIRYDSTTGHPFKGEHFLKFSGAYKFRVTVNSVSSPELGSNIPLVLRLEGKTIVKRKYNFNATSTGVTKITTGTDRILLSWIPANYAGAELFDLEYTVIDDSSAYGNLIRQNIANSTSFSAQQLSGFFKNNSTRITTPKDTFSVNQVYKGGYLVFRIRGVQFKNEYQGNLTAAELNIRTEGNWNYQAVKVDDPSYTYNVVALEWHEPLLNWQYSVSFAEEGKKKEVIGYFDGLFKNRQNVTVDNASSHAIVQETVLDAQGRPAVNMLPSPTADGTIHYYRGFNRNVDQDTYSFEDIAAGSACTDTAAVVSETYGAGKYYSSQNDINDYFFKKYIPQAEGYPYALTLYTPDNTGRIVAQGGVGERLQPGKGHETKYFYGKPTQDEIDRLFGNESGNALHFLKNMVVDPNGQISVSYLNSAGQTVATALAGITPDGLEQLPSNDNVGTSIRQSLLPDADFKKEPDNGFKVGNTSFLAPISGVYKFYYSLTPLRMDVLYGPENQYKLCNTCYYDLEIFVKDNCGITKGSVVKHLDPETVFNTNCGYTAPVISDSFSVTIQGHEIGDYNVTYEIKVSEAALHFYDSLHLAQNTDLRKLKSFFLEKLTQSNFLDCFSDCKTCLTTLGTKTDFVNTRIKPLFIEADSLAFTTEFESWANDLYDTLLARCNASQAGCDPSSPCDEEKMLLLEDVKPGGQYALYDSVYNLLDTDILNVLTSRFTRTFYNEDGSPGKITYNGVEYDANSHSIPDSVFIQNFDPGWAEALISLHPEYCYYSWCLQNSDSKAFDNKITALENDSVATALGYFSSFSSLFNADPFFASGGKGYPYASMMYDRLNNYSKTVYGYPASAPVKNILAYNDYELYCAPDSVSPSSCTAPSSTCRSRYMEWQLYKEGYLQLKSYFNELARLADNPNCKNCFIGSDNTGYFGGCVPAGPADFRIAKWVSQYAPFGRIDLYYDENARAIAPCDYEIVIRFNYNGTTGKKKFIFHQGDSVAHYSTDDLMIQEGSEVWIEGVYCVSEGGAPLPDGCPCPVASDFYYEYYLSGEQFWSDEIYVRYYGDTIPVGRTVTLTFQYYDTSLVLRDLQVQFTGGGSRDVWEEVPIPSFFPEALWLVNVSCQDAYNYTCPYNPSGEACPCPGMEQFQYQPLFYSINCGNVSSIIIINAGDSIPEGRSVDVYFTYNHPLYGYQPGFVTFEPGEPFKEFCLDDLYYIDEIYIDSTQCHDAPFFTCGGALSISLCREDPRYARFSQKIRRYNEYVDMTSTEAKFATEQPDFVDEKTAEMNAEALSNCEAQADVWINALKGCVGTPVELDTLRARLIAICQEGSSPQNLGGTSDGKGLADDFEAAIRSVFPNASESCTAELIANPYPHNRQPLYERGIYLQVEACLQTRFNELKGYYLTSGFSGSFHQWLQKQLKGDYKLTEAELTSLETQLASGCRYLKKPLELPVAMSCNPNNSAPSCVDSASMASLLNDFNTQYPNIDSSYDNYEVLLTNYLNHHLAFALNYEDYQSFMHKMQTGTVNKDMLCARSQSSYLDGISEVNNCLSDVFFVAYSEALTNYTAYIDSVRAAFRMAYFEKCLNGAAFLEMKSNYLEYHYTLYYYDQSGNLVKTVPPKGVEVGTVEQIQQTRQYRTNSDKSCFTDQPYVAFTGSNLVNIVPASSYISQLNSPNVTVEAFIKLNDFSNQGIFSLDTLQFGMYQNGFSLFIRNNKLVVRSGLKAADQGRDMSERETAVVSDFMETSRWYHVAIALGYPSDQIFLYIDGMKITLTALDSNIPYFGNDGGVVQVPLKLGGAWHNGTIDYMHGDMRQFRMYKRILSQGEIVKNASSECLLPSNPTELWAYVPLYEGIGNAMDYTNGYIGVASSDTIPWANYVPPYYPAHTYATLYEYNSFNQVVKQQTPDADSSRFWYDVLGRLVASQNEEQRDPKNTYSNPNSGRYSYTKYDAQGRITEVGEKRGGGQMSDNVAKNISLLSYWFNNTGTDYDVTQTYYDNPATTVVPHTGITDLQALNSRKRVVTTLYKEAKANNYYDQATHYVYDISGNVKTQFEEVRSFMQALPVASRYPRRIDYDYDLVSGKVNRVAYEKNKGDQFYHKFEYDPENRITGVFSSRDGLRWENEARYYYYLHGPLARVELGERKVQGVDYAYTLQGWLKGINSQTLDPEEDMAGDGLASSPLFKNMSRDVYGFSIGYHGNDYQPIGTTTAPAFNPGFTSPSGQVGTNGHTGYELFNGNIRNTTVALSRLNNGATVGYSYLYDQLNRLTATKQHTVSGSSWSYSSFGEAYRERTTYDANGNILRYLRQGANISGQPKDMDSLTYHYLAGTNKLNYVHDAVNDANYGTDIDLKNQSVDNYDYDRIGNLMSDVKGNAGHISWNVYGKIRSIVKTNGDTISYGYNSAGNRVEKRVAKGSIVNRYIYIRDAQGNVLSVYRDSSGTVNLEEQHLYGSARLGMWKYSKSLPPDTTPTGLSYDSSLIGSKEFELTNHLGNVLSVISDKKIGVEATGGLVDHYKSEVLNQQDFYPFGMRQPNRSYSISGSYRYGFNGKENDNEVKGEGNQQDYGMRIYDPRVGRFLSVDPIADGYPELTPYQFASNRPIDGIDLDGLEHANYSYNSSGIKNIRESEEKERKTRTEMDVKRDAAVKVNMIPGVGDAKGFVETFTGTDMITGEKLSITDRIFGLFFLSEVRSLKPIKAVDNIKAVENVSENVNKIDKAVSTEKAIVKNKRVGDLREVKEEQILRTNNPGANVQNQQYLRDANGKIMKDPLTGEGRRLDHVVIKDGKAVDVVETTSKTANKTSQIAKENRIREAGGTFVRDRTTKKLVDVKDIPTRISRHD